MSLLDSIIGGSSTTKSSGSQNTTTDQTQNTKQTQNTTTEQSQQSQSTGQQQTQLLDNETIAKVKSLIDNISAAGGGASDKTQSGIDQLNTFLSSLATRANNEPANLAATIKAQQAEATRNFNLTTGQQIAETQQQTGSRLGNSFSQLLQQQGNTELQTALAKIASDATLQANAQQSADLGTVAQFMATLPQIQSNSETNSTNNAAALLQILKGARSSSQTSDQSTATMKQIVDALLQSDTTTNQKSTTSSASSSKTSSGLLGMIF